MNKRWRSMDKAPKDKNILLLVDGQVVEGNWRFDQFRRVTFESDGCGCCAGTDGIPTHWMPLPEPPK